MCLFVCHFIFTFSLRFLFFIFFVRFVCLYSNHLHSKQFPSHSIRVHSRILKYCIELQALGKKMNKGSCCLCARISSATITYKPEKKILDRYALQCCTNSDMPIAEVAKCQQYQQTPANAMAHNTQ